MPLVKSEAVIEAPFEQLWELAQGVEKMPEFMPDLVAVKLLEDEQLSPTKRRTVTDWTARIKQFNRNVHWIEEDISHDAMRGWTSSSDQREVIWECRLCCLLTSLQPLFRPLLS